MKRLEYLYANDRRALMDFVGCNSDCDDCRARPYCDDYTSQDELNEPQWLMSDVVEPSEGQLRPECGHDIIGSTENGTATMEADVLPA